MGEYIIQPGDTLSKIAKMTGTTVENLQKLNGIKNANLIFAGKTIQIPDIESDQAFNIKGLSVEREIPKGEMRLVYAYIPPEGEGKGNAPKDKIELPKGEIRTVYAYIPPEEEGREDGGKWRAPMLPPEDDEVRYEPMYAYKPPVDGKDGKDDGGKWRFPWLPGDGNIKPVYAYVPPRDDGEDDGVPPLLKRPGEDDEVQDPPIKLVYAYLPPGDDDKVIIKPPLLPEPVADPTITASAKDTELLEKRGASKTVNDPNGRAQFVVGDEAGEVSVTGDKARPDSITIKDDTNGHNNTYTYRLITDKEIADGKTYDGIPLSKAQFEGANGPFYLLIKAENEAGDNLKRDHVEVYRLEYTERDDGSRSYDLVQDEGMDGSGRSSMDYRRK